MSKEIKKECSCAESTCPEDCSRNHTHKNVWCENCHPVTTSQDSSISSSECKHNNIESNMCPTTCLDCGKVLVEPLGNSEQLNTEELIEKHWDEFLKRYYLQSCKGCPEGHSSFWRTILLSPQWKLWQQEQQRNMTRDMSECEELGIISDSHFQEFMKFIVSQSLIRSKMEKKI